MKLGSTGKSYGFGGKNRQKKRQVIGRNKPSASQESEKGFLCAWHLSVDSCPPLHSIVTARDESNGVSIKGLQSNA